MKKVVIGYISILIFASSIPLSFAENVAKIVNDANRLYNTKKYDEALEKYNEALTKLPGSEIIHFNEGSAYYQKGDYQRAEESFLKALLTDDKSLEAKANYNIGNCQYRQGKLKQNTDLAEAINSYRQSLDYYKRAIELDERDKDAKFNHEYVEKELKILLDRLKEQQEESKGEESQEEQGQQITREQQTSQGQEESEEKQEQEEQGVEQKGEEKMSEIEESEVPQEGIQEMSEEEARMLLEGYRQEEESAGDILQDSRRGYEGRVLKDW